MQTNKVAILMRTKNRPLLLQRAIQSVIDQTFSHWHLVIINDGGSMQAVEEVVLKFKHKLVDKVTLLHHLETKGMAAASNSGINASDSEYIALLDDDDTWDKTFLDQTVDYLNSQGPTSIVKGVATYTNAIGENIDSQGITVVYIKKYALQPKQITLCDLLLENQFTNLSFVYRRDVFASIGYYDETLRFFDDWDFNMRFAKLYEIGLLPKFLANYHFRLKTNQASGSENALGLREDKALYMGKFRDSKLRQDLQAGTLGLGTMMHLSYQSLKVLPAKTSLLKAIKHDLLWLKGKMADLKENIYNTFRAYARNR